MSYDMFINIFKDYDFNAFTNTKGIRMKMCPTSKEKKIYIPKYFRTW